MHLRLLAFALSIPLMTACSGSLSRTALQRPAPAPIPDRQLLLIDPLIEPDLTEEQRRQYLEIQDTNRRTRLARGRPQAEMLLLLQEPNANPTLPLPGGGILTLRNIQALRPSIYSAAVDPWGTATLTVADYGLFGLIHGPDDAFTILPLGDDKYVLADEITPEDEDDTEPHPFAAGAWPGRVEQCPGEGALSIRLAFTEAALSSYPHGLSSILGVMADIEVVLKNSGIDLTFDVRTSRASGSESSSLKMDLKRLLDPGDSHWDPLFNARDTDLVVLVMRHREDKSAFGRATVGASKDTAFAVAKAAGVFNAARNTLGHELGHLAGARHEHDTTPAPFPNARGFVKEKFRTMMATLACTGCRRQPYFADPAAQLPNNGGPMGKRGENEVVGTLTGTLPYLAAFECR